MRKSNNWVNSIYNLHFFIDNGLKEKIEKFYEIFGEGQKSVFILNICIFTYPAELAIFLRSLNVLIKVIGAFF